LSKRASPMERRARSEAQPSEVRKGKRASPMERRARSEPKVSEVHKAGGEPFAQRPDL